MAFKSCKNRLYLKKVDACSPQYKKTSFFGDRNFQNANSHQNISDRLNDTCKCRGDEEKLQAGL